MYDLSPAELAVLGRACRVLDRLADIDQLTMNSKPLINSGGVVRENPAYIAARAEEKLLESLIRSLALPLPGESGGTVRTPAAAEAARKLWAGKNRTKNGTLANCG